ncbi:MAG TPA: aminoglycoside adenylyltransferase family protein [Candidatus Limnocylindrales bacterium]
MDQTAEVLTLVRSVLGDAVLGIYLHGSGALGTLRPASDIDLFAVTRRRTTEAERRDLIEGLLPISGPGDTTGRSRPINVEIVAQPDVRPWRYPGRLDFQFGDWYRPEFARGNFAPWNPHNPDVGLLVKVVLQADRPLFGPQPAEILDPVPEVDIRHAMLDSIPDLLGYLDGDEGNVILTLVRIWTTLATGVIRTKDGAADWALPLLPAQQRPVLEHARAIYLGDATEAWGDLLPRVRPLVDHVIGEIERAATRAAAVA